MLKVIQYKEKRRNQGQIQKPSRMLDEVLCNFLQLTVVAKNSFLNVAEFWIHLENFAMHENYSAFRGETSLFSIISEYGQLY